MDGEGVEKKRAAPGEERWAASCEAGTNNRFRKGANKFESAVWDGSKKGKRTKQLQAMQGKGHRRKEKAHTAEGGKPAKQR